MTSRKQVLKRAAQRIVYVAHSSLAAGFIVGTATALLSDAGASKASPVLPTGAALGLLLALLGLAASALLELARIVRTSALAQRLRPAHDSPAETDDAPFRVRLHAELLAGAVGVTIFASLFLIIAGVAEGVQVPELKTAVLLGSVVACCSGTMLTARLVTPLFVRMFARVDAAVGLPIPKAPWAWALLYLTAPVSAVMAWVLLAFGDTLGLLSLAPAALAGGAVALQLHLCARALTVRTAGSRKWLSAGAALATWALVIPGCSRLQDEQTAKLAKVPLLTAGSQALQRLTDVDGDGASALFGGTDCAAWNGDRFPGARELPDNGIDEDCDGNDLERVATHSPEHRVYHGKLEEELVRPYNILWIVVDSLRADHMSLYGYAENTTPFTKWLGKQAWVFNRAFSQASNTSISMPSIFSGLDPGSFDWRQGKNYPTPKEAPVYVQKLLADAGYYTAITVNNRINRRIPAVRHDYEHVMVTPKRADWTSSDYSVSNAMLAMKEAELAEQPFMVTVFLDGVHAPYKGGKGRPVPKFEHENDEVSKYDRGIAGFDLTMRALITHLKNADLWDDTIVVLTADHGEEFGEHGGRLHSMSCHVESVHVPLLVRVPGFEAKRVDANVALTDIVPTLLEAVGLDEKAEELDGQSLFVPVLDEPQLDEERPVFCTIYQVYKRREDFFTRSVRSGNLVLMHEFLSGETKLYDSKEDFEETRNLVTDRKYERQRKRLLELIKVTKQSNVFEARTLN